MARPTWDFLRRLGKQARKRRPDGRTSSPRVKSTSFALRGEPLEGRRLLTILTSIVQDLYPGDTGSVPALFTSVGNNVYYFAGGGDRSLFRSAATGTGATTVSHGHSIRTLDALLEES